MFALSAERKKKVSWCWIFNQITIICVASVITSRNKLNIFSHIKIFLPGIGFLNLCDLFYHMERDKNRRSIKNNCEILHKRYHCIVRSGHCPLVTDWLVTARQNRQHLSLTWGSTFNTSHWALDLTGAFVLIRKKLFLKFSCHLSLN